jgi:DNA-binding transcriptional LysR family regulator
MQRSPNLGGVDFLQHLATFVRIADAGTISEAARSIGLSVAMASRQLRALEKHLGVSLVRRTTRHLSLTEDGTELLSRARSLLASAEETREAVRPGRGVAGRIVVSLPVSLGVSQMSPLFPALLERHPRLRLDLRFEDRMVDLLGDGIDLAIRAGSEPPDSPFLVARRLASLRRLLCAAPGFLRRHGPVKSLDALQRLPCIVQGSPPTRWHFETADGPAWIDVDGRMRSNNVIALRDAALAGAGIARLPEWIVAEDLQAKRLVQLLPALQLVAVEVHAIYHRDSRGSTALREVVDHLARELPKRMMAVR